MDLLGPRLRQIRKAAKKTQEQVCADSGLTQAMISAFENGKGDPSLSTLRKVAKGYGVAVAMLFSDEAPPELPPPWKPSQLDIALYLFDHGESMHRPDAVELFKKALESSEAEVKVMIQNLERMQSLDRPDSGAGNEGL